MKTILGVLSGIFTGMLIAMVVLFVMLVGNFKGDQLVLENCLQKNRATMLGGGEIICVVVGSNQTLEIK